MFSGSPLRVVRDAECKDSRLWTMHLLTWFLGDAGKRMHTYGREGRCEGSRVWCPAGYSLEGWHSDLPPST
jgi:hypothetical protein